MGPIVTYHVGDWLSRDQKASNEFGNYIQSWQTNFGLVASQNDGLARTDRGLTDCGYYSYRH